jgi:hypothetical protein
VNARRGAKIQMERLTLREFFIARDADTKDH